MYLMLMCFLFWVFELSAFKLFGHPVPRTYKRVKWTQNVYCQGELIARSCRNSGHARKYADAHNGKYKSRVSVTMVIIYRT